MAQVFSNILKMSGQVLVAASSPAIPSSPRLTSGLSVLSGLDHKVRGHWQLQKHAQTSQVFKTCEV
jgi:hypothetical protein